MSTGRASRMVCAWGALLAMAPVAAAGARGIDAEGFVAVQAIVVEGEPSWLAGGFGRLGAGASASTERDTVAAAQARLGLEWTPAARFGARLQLAGDGESAGVVEAFGQALFPVAATGELRLRVGAFFLPTSRENVEPLWTSPYTLTLSAWNTWVGEELRPTGLDLGWRAAPDAGPSLGATLFGGNDSAGALLAWRGFAMGDHLAVWGEELPLPPLASLAPDGAFADQTDAGTRPLERDLDGRPGWAGRARWSGAAGSLAQWTRLDSRGDRRLHGGEYAWRTRFDLLGFELPLGGAWRVVGEAAQGDTGMGPPAGPRVDLDFRAGYLLLSGSRGRGRLSLRYDRFRARDRDASAGEVNEEDGRALTLAWLVQPRPWLRLGAEVLDLEAERPPGSGFPAPGGGRSLRIELRATF